MLDSAESTRDVFGDEAVVARVGSISDVLDSVESMIDVLGDEAVVARVGSISDVLDSVESMIDVLGGAADVCVVLLAVVAITTPTPPNSGVVYWPSCSLVYVG